MASLTIRCVVDERIQGLSSNSKREQFQRACSAAWSSVAKKNNIQYSFKKQGNWQLKKGYMVDQVKFSHDLMSLLYHPCVLARRST